MKGRPKLVTVEVVKAKDLKVNDIVLWSNHEVRVTRIAGSTVWILTLGGVKATDWVHYYRVVKEKVVFT